MSTFWINFIVVEAVAAAQAYVAVAVAAKRPALAQALDNLVTAGQAVITALQSGN